MLGKTAVEINELWGNRLDYQADAILPKTLMDHM